MPCKHFLWYEVMYYCWQFWRISLYHMAVTKYIIYSIHIHTYVHKSCKYIAIGYWFSVNTKRVWQLTMCNYLACLK